MVLCNKPVWPKVMEQKKKMDSVCSMQQTVYLCEVNVVTA